MLRSNVINHTGTESTIDDRVAPALQAAKERLERSQLEDKLGQALQHRPKAEELVKEGILQRKCLNYPSMFEYNSAHGGMVIVYIADEAPASDV